MASRVGTSAVALCVAVLSLSSCGEANDSVNTADKPKKETFTVTGTVTVTQVYVPHCTLVDAENSFEEKCDKPVAIGEPCTTSEGVQTGPSPFVDIVEGGQVKITTGARAVVGLSNLGGGVRVSSDQRPHTLACQFAFKIADVPVDKVDIYGLEIGKRDPYNFKQADAASLDVTLG